MAVITATRALYAIEPGTEAARPGMNPNSSDTNVK